MTFLIPASSFSAENVAEPKTLWRKAPPSIVQFPEGENIFRKSCVGLDARLNIHFLRKESKSAHHISKTPALPSEEPTSMPSMIAISPPVLVPTMRSKTSHGLGSLLRSFSGRMRYCTSTAGGCTATKVLERPPPSSPNQQTVSIAFGKRWRLSPR